MYVTFEFCLWCPSFDTFVVDCGGDFFFFSPPAGNKELPPRFKNKIMLAQQQGQGNLEDVSLRPAPMSMMFKQANTKPPSLNPGTLHVWKDADFVSYILLSS